MKIRDSSLIRIHVTIMENNCSLQTALVNCASAWLREDYDQIEFCDINTNHPIKFILWVKLNNLKPQFFDAVVSGGAIADFTKQIYPLCKVHAIEPC